jgi:hypothetical protein
MWCVSLTGVCQLQVCVSYRCVSVTEVCQQCATPKLMISVRCVLLQEKCFNKISAVLNREWWDRKFALSVTDVTLYGGKQCTGTTHQLCTYLQPTVFRSHPSCAHWISGYRRLKSTEHSPNDLITETETSATQFTRTDIELYPGLNKLPHRLCNK